MKTQSNSGKWIHDEWEWVQSFPSNTKWVGLRWQGWQLLAPHFSDLLEKAIFPTLIMREMVGIFCELPIIWILLQPQKVQYASKRDDSFNLRIEFSWFRRWLNLFRPCTSILHRSSTGSTHSTFLAVACFKGSVSCEEQEHIGVDDDDRVWPT
jgi:hypothetical protein